MAHRKVICDSEDEDNEDFIDLDSHSPRQEPTIALTADGGEERSPEDPNSDSRSTDPEFFRRIYEDQQNATATFIPDTLRTQPETRTFASSLLSSSSAAVKQKSSSSLTDPTMVRSSLKKKRKETEPKDLKDMTQVTTPDAPVTKRKDIYDFDFSDQEGAGAGAGSSVPKPKFKAIKIEASGKADGKRKRSTPKFSYQETDVHSNSPPQQLATRDDGSSATHPIELDDDDSPRPTRKKRKSGGHQQTAREVPDDVDLLVIPTTADINESLRELDEGSGNLGSVINDTLETPQSKSDPVSASSLVIVPPSLTASQKQQYLRVSGSSELDQDRFGTDDHQQQVFLPAPKSQSQGFRSTNTESTIPYTTPSRYYSSAAPLGVMEDQSEQMMQPDCSPDELSAHPVEIMSRANKRKSSPEQEDELVQDDSLDSDKVGFSRENYVPRPSKRRSRAVLEEEEADEVTAPEQSMPDTCPPGDTNVEELEGVQDFSINEAQATQDFSLRGVDPDFLAALPDDIRQEVINSHKPGGHTQIARTRSRARPEEASSGPPPAHEEPQPKKRGRKKKLPANDDSIAPEADDAGAKPSPAPLASAKRKRGRPKKTEPTPAAVIQDDRPAQDESGLNPPEIAEEPRKKDSPLIEDAQVTPQATKVARKRGRKKKIVEEAPESVQEDPNESMHETGIAFEAHQDTDGVLEQDPERPMEKSGDGTEPSGRSALRDISNNVMDKESVTDHADSEMNKDATPVSKYKDKSKSVLTPTSQADKVRYRVGLSKRSRIAPLLKMIRK